MRAFSVFLSDLPISLKRLPWLAAAMLLSGFCFLQALPPSLIQSGTFSKISIALVFNDNFEIIDIFKTVVRGIAMVDSFDVLNKEAALEALENKEVDVVVEVPDEFVDALITRRKSLVKVYATDAFIGAYAFSAMNEAVKAINTLQCAVLEYQYSARPYFDDDSSYYQAEMAFSLSLLKEVFTRSNKISIVWASNPYQLRVLSLAMFIAASISSVFVSAFTAGQFSSGHMRRLAIRGIRIWHVWTSKAALAICLSAILCLLLAPALNSLNISFSIPKLFASTMLLSLILSSFCMLFSHHPQKAPAAAARAMLGCAGLLLFMLFSGGGFYPAHLMGVSFQAFNPAWMSHLLSDWSLGGAALKPLSLLAFALPSMACWAISEFKWRNSLC